MAIGKREAEKIYEECRSEIIRASRDPELGQDAIRLLLMCAISQTVLAVPQPAVHMPFVRSYQIMLKKVGGPILSEDQQKILDQAKDEPGPSIESLKQAFANLGLELPPGMDQPEPSRIT